jgi:hypothetical protein
MIDGLQDINLLPGELIFPSSRIVVRSATALDPEQVRRAVGVRGAAGVVSVDRSGTRVTWRPNDDTAPGWYRFRIDALVSKRGRAVSPGGEIHFGLVRSSARVPQRVAVESMLRLRVGPLGMTRLDHFDASTRGKYVELMKASDRTSGAPVPLAFDEHGARIDANALVAGVIAARAKRVGKLHPDLDAHLRSMESNQRVSVAIWAPMDDIVDPGDKPPDRPLDEDELARQFARRADRIQEVTATLISELRAEVRKVEPDELAPVVYATLTKEAIRRLQRSERVSAIFPYDARGYDDLDDSIAVAQSDDVHALGNRGRGVRVAVWERGPDDTSNLDIEDRFDTPGSMSSHSRLVHGVIKNIQDDAPNGHAPDCLLYSANSYDLSALRWAVRDARCTVVNQSFHRDDEQTSDSLSFDDIYKDWLILQSPFPTIVQAAGNGSDTEYVNHKGYNSIAVANHSDDASALSSTSVSRNPDSDHSDRELPEISANGTGVTAVGVTNSGTSFASPAAAGIAALLQSNDAVLRSWPEGCRAILLAGATTNIVDSTWWQDVAGGTDAADGSGAANALEAHRISESRTSRDAPASRRGWDVGVIDDDDFDRNGLSTFTYRVAVPTWVIGPTHVKVALAWNSKVKEFDLFGIKIPVSSRLEQDLDLKIYDSSGSLVAHSQSWDNSYEIAEFDGRRGAEYTIKVRRWSGTGWTWYGLAWTVTGGLLDLIRLGRIAFEEEFIPPVIGVTRRSAEDLE